MNIAEGFRRYDAREFARFLTMALALLTEAMPWLRDGIDSGRFPRGADDDAQRLGRRCYVATLRLKQSLRTNRP